MTFLPIFTSTYSINTLNFRLNINLIFNIYLNQLKSTYIASIFKQRLSFQIKFWFHFPIVFMHMYSNIQVYDRAMVNELILTFLNAIFILIFYKYHDVCKFTNMLKP